MLKYLMLTVIIAIASGVWAQGNASNTACLALNNPANSNSVIDVTGTDESPGSNNTLYVAASNGIYETNELHRRLYAVVVPTPWTVIPQERLDAVRADFLALTNPVLDCYAVEAGRRSSNPDLSICHISLSPNAQRFADEHASTPWADLEVAVALFPFLNSNVTISGEAALMLSKVQGVVVANDFRNCGYLSPTNRGSWDTVGPKIRKEIRRSVRSSCWLDKQGMPSVVTSGGMVVNGKRYLVGSMPDVREEDCTDEAANSR